MTKDKQTFEVKFQLPADQPCAREILEGVLVGMGIQPEEFVELNQDQQIFLSIFVKEERKARKIRNAIARLKLRDVQVRSKKLLNKDWQNLWLKEFKPFALTSKIEVVPQWLRTKHKVKRGFIPVYIDTSVAFGTGLHATTRFMAHCIEAKHKHYNDFIDIGTGTGILAIIAAKFGATYIDAVDISAEAIKIAQSNVDKNECRVDRLEAIDFKRFKTRKRYDFVAANLITQDLIALKLRIVKLVKPGKYLAISGVSLSNYELIRESFADMPLRCLKVYKGEGWCAILFKKKDV